MKIIYDPETDALSMLFNDKPVFESDEEHPGFILDYDQAGNMVGLEILDASKRVSSPQSLEYSVTHSVKKAS